MKQFIIFLLIISSASCIEPYEFTVGNYDKNLVVEAIFTDEEKYHQVKLTYTTPIISKEEIFATGAVVSISTNTGETIPFQEIRPGTYQTRDSTSGIADTEYKLNIVTANGRQYESSTEKLQKGEPITSLYARYENVVSDKLNRNEGGIQFFIDTEANGKPAYYRYEWEETYLLVVPFPSEWRFIFADSRVVEREQIIRRCFQVLSSNELLIANSVSNDLNNIRAFPLHFIGNERESEAPHRLRYRYSLLAKQYKVSSSTYEFYRKLKAINESGGSLFDEQQGAITGNMISLIDNNETVLGNFEVSGVSTLREFFNPNDYETPFERPESIFSCSFGNDFFSPDTDSLPELLRAGIYDIYKILEGFGGGLYVGPKSCVRCDHFANPIEPDYWID